MTTTDTQNRILDAAEHCVMEHGVANLTLDSVAARAGVSKGGLLYHYAGKDALVAALIARLTLAHIVRLAVDGIWMNEAFGIEPLDPVTRTAVIERLLTLTRETSLPAQGKD